MKLFAKKSICAVLSVIFAVLCLPGCNSNESNNISDINQTQVTETTEPEINLNIENLNAKNAIIFDVNSNREIYSKNIYDRISIASITKLLTACVALKYCETDTVFTVGSELELLNKNSSICHLSKGCRLTLYDLMCGMLMVSGNDAAYTIAANVGRIIKKDKNISDKEAVRIFCNKMNILAMNIGMIDSHFSSPDGWDADDHYSTINDLVTLVKFAMNKKEIKDIVSCPVRYEIFESGQNITWKNSNLLLDKNGPYYRRNVTGMKTGTTSNAGNCLVLTYEKSGHKMIIIIMGCKTNESRYADAVYLVDKLDENL